MNKSSREKCNNWLQTLQDHSAVNYRFQSLGCDRIHFMQKSAFGVHTEPQQAFKRRVKRCPCFFPAGSCVIMLWMQPRSYPWSWTSSRVPEVCCSLPRPMKEYRLFVIGSVTAEFTRQQMPRTEKKRFRGWNVMWTVGFNHWTPQGCYRLPSMLLKAKGWFRRGFAVILPRSVSSRHRRGGGFVKVNQISPEPELRQKGVESDSKMQSETGA